MNKYVKSTALFLFAILIVPAAFAITLQEAKSQGLVGEQRDGYVGFVTSNVPAEVAELVREVNEQRRQRYQQIAQENGIAEEQVRALAYEQAVGATQPGHFLQNASGAWVKK